MNALSRSVLFISLLILTAMCSGQKTEEQEKMSDFSKNWQLFSSEQTMAKGSHISTSAFTIQDGYEIDIPSTVMAALVKKEVYKDVFFSDNLKDIPKAPFQVPWWYRKTFHINEITQKQFYELIFEGLNYKANIWLNGRQIASSENVEGCFRMFEFDITQFLNEGENVLAVEVIPPKRGDLTIGFVDWNPWPPDNNMGLWRPVKLKKSGKVALKNVFVKPDLDIDDLNEAKIQITAEVVNHSDNPVNGTLEIAFDNSIIEKDIQLGPNETRKIELLPSEFESLIIVNPKLWWPHNLGEPYLYELNAKLLSENRITDSSDIQFGIRDVRDYFNENGHRGYKINGKEILIKGAGWVDDIFLDDSDEKVLDQLRYVKHMNLNTIRLEGFWGKNKTIYEMADRLGILIMIGWSCQWEWEDYCGRPESEYLAIRGEKEISEHAQAYQDQVEWLRNHPSVFLWVYGSDKLLVPELEQRLNKKIGRAHV